MPGRTAPVLVQRALLLDVQRVPDPARVAELVAFQRSGRRVLVLARQPVRWRPTLSSVDEDLGLQQALHQAMRRAGGEMDGVLYLTVGLFARRQSRIDELTQLATRYRIDSGELIAIGSEHSLLESVIHAGGRALLVGEQSLAGASRHDSLKSALHALSGLA